MCGNAHARPAAARATLDAALAAGQARDDVWWLPEVMRLRAAYEDATGRVSKAAFGGADGRPRTAASRCSGAASATWPRCRWPAFASVRRVR